MSYKVKSWKAVHSSGTKFYQVVRVISESDKMGFALSNYGPVGSFVGLGKITAGQCEDLGFGSSADIGDVKQKQKIKDGYTKNTETEDKSFADLNSLKAWAKSSLGSKAMAFFKAHSAKQGFQGIANAVDDIPIPDLGPEEADHVKHAEWGSW
jgi:hypothetical protein